MSGLWEFFENINRHEQQRNATERSQNPEAIIKILDGILRSAGIGIWTIELEEGCAPRMYADGTMRVLLGVSEDIGTEECYRCWVKHIEPDSAKMAPELVQEMIETGYSEAVYPWKHSTLGKIYVRCGGMQDRTFQKQGVCLNGYCQDITEMVATREKQEQTIIKLLEKVRQANSVKSEFLSHMSHDLRTPVNGILGMLTVMENSQDDPRKQEECRKKIRVSAEHLLSLVNDVLDMNRLESGKPVIAEESFDLYNILEDCMTILSSQAEEANVHVVLEEMDVCHSRLIGSPLHLKQVLMSMIDNSIKYNRPDGFVYVRVKEYASREGYADYRFVIEDTGIGIRDDFKKHIFEPFTQADQGARTHYKGTGLGMSIVKKLVDQMKGMIEVESELGKGSIFRVTLPVRIDAGWDRQSIDEEKSAQTDISGMHILLAEDNEVNCQIMKFVLKKADASVKTVENGKAAVDAFTAADPGTFDCILMDLMMPVMSGYEAARTIRSLDRPDAEMVPIIALSANAFEEDVAMAKDAGMNEHLAKPVDMHRLFRTMHRLGSQSLCL